MIITKNFVFINYPKTGTTFARSAIALAYGKSRTKAHRLLRKFVSKDKQVHDLKFPKLYGNYDPSYCDQHGVYRQIPVEDRHKIIGSIVRNPLQKYISSYVYGWWRKHPPYEIDLLLRDFPGFPDITFSEFYNMLNHPNAVEDKIAASGAREIGSYTRMFLVFYSLNPNSAAASLIDGEPLQSIIPKISFLHQEKLMDNLAIFLRKAGLRDNQVRRIYTQDDLNVSAREDKAKISQEDIKVVSQKILSDERHFLDAFPEYLEQTKSSMNNGSMEVLVNGCSEIRVVGR